MKKSSKALKDAKVIKEKKITKSKKGNSAVMLLGIQNKIALCFLVPIIFMIIIGFSAYRKSAEGMSEKFQESTIQTIDMVNEYGIMQAPTLIELRNGGNQL